MSDVIVAELDSADGLLEAVRRTRELGYRRVEAFTPFLVPELDVALGLRRTRLPRIVFAAGLSGLLVGLAIQWWTNAIDYPLNVGGRPLFSLPANVPIVFETTVLFAALASFAGVLLGARLPRLHDPIFDLPGFERTSVDRFWVVIDDVAPLTDGEAATGERGERLRSIEEDELARLRSALEDAGASVRRYSRERSSP